MSTSVIYSQLVWVRHKLIEASSDFANKSTDTHSTDYIGVKSDKEKN